MHLPCLALSPELGPHAFCGVPLQIATPLVRGLVTCSSALYSAPRSHTLTHRIQLVSWEVPGLSDVCLCETD